MEGNNNHQDIKVSERRVVLSKLAQEMSSHEGIPVEVVMEAARKGKAVTMSASGKVKRFLPTSQGVVVVITGRLWGNQPGLCVMTVYRTTIGHMESAIALHHRKKNQKNKTKDAIPHYHHHQDGEQHSLFSTLALLRGHPKSTIRQGQFQEILRRDPQVLLSHYQIIEDVLLASLSDQSIMVQIQALRTLSKLWLSPASLFYHHRDAAMVVFNKVLLQLSMDRKSKELAHQARKCLTLFQVEHDTPVLVNHDDDDTPLAG